MKYFYDYAHTIGGYIIFSGNKINGLYTINQERGTNIKINDRFDLTLECIKRFYQNENSPMSDTFFRYADFFNLFSNFKGYCEFFLLQDLTINNYSKVKFFLPFNGFVNNPLPQNIDEYHEYKNNNIEFLKKRNKRIDEYSNKNY